MNPTTDTEAAPARTMMKPPGTTRKKTPTSSRIGRLIRTGA
jgi:hypothetical protein